MLKREFPEMLRFFGPVSKSEAEYIIEGLFDSKHFYSDLIAFLTGEIEGREHQYRTQILAENIEAARKRKAGA